MIHNFSIKLAHYLVRNGVKQDEKILVYGAECLLNEAISITLLFFLGLFTNSILELLIWSCSFCLLRTQMGGVHAPTHALCIASGFVLGASSLVISPFFVEYRLAGLISSGIALVVAILISPVKHKHKGYLQKKKVLIKKLVAMIAALDFFVLITLYIYMPEFASFVVSGILMAVFLGLSGMVWNPK